MDGEEERWALGGFAIASLPRPFIQSTHLRIPELSLCTSLPGTYDMVCEAAMYEIHPGFRGIAAAPPIEKG